MARYCIIVLLGVLSAPLFSAAPRWCPKPVDTVPEIYPFEQPEKVPPGFHENPYRENSPEPEPLKTEREAQMILFTRALTNPVWAETRPKPFERCRKLSAWGAPGQFVLLNFAVYPLADLKKLKVRVNSPVQPEITRIGCWKKLYPKYNSHAGKQYRRMPEYMIPMTLCDAPKGESQRFVLSFRIPEEQKQGTVHGEILVFHDTFDKAALLPFQIEVLPIRLEKDPNKHYTAYYYDIRDQHSIFYKRNKDNEELLHRLQLREYSQLLDFGFTRPPGMLLRYDSDNDKLFIMNIDKMLGELREAGFDLRQPLMLSGSGEYHFFAKHTGKKVLPHYPGITELPESYFREMKEKIAAFMKEAARKQYPPFVFNPVDEPATENRFWLKRLYALFRELGGRTVFTSAPPFVREEMDAEVDIYSDGSFRYPYEKAVSGDKKEYWAYPNNVAYQISDPEIMCRNGRMVYGFGFWKSGYHQLMPWVWRLPNSNGHFQGRGGNLQLPDGTVAPGLYWACFREGIYDLNYLYTLQCAVARREKNAIPGCRALIRRARALIQKTWDDIPVRADYSAGSVFPHEEYDARRAEFADLILRLIAYPEDAGNAEVPSVLADTRGKRNPERTFDESSLAVFPLTCWRAHEREASLVQEGNETHLRIQVDHSADGFSTPGTPPKYLCGWPRMIFDFPQKTDLNAYPYLAFELKVDSNRNGEANESWPMWIQAVAKGTIRTIGEITSLQPATWHTFVLPLEDARLREAVRIQIGISENQYSDRADLHFRFRNLRLLAFRTPAPLNLRYAGKIEKRTQFLSVDFELAGPREQCDEIVLALSDAQGRTLDRVSMAPAQYISGGLGLGKCNPGRHTLGIEILKNGRSVFRKSGTVDVIDVFCKGKQEK